MSSDLGRDDGESEEQAGVAASPVLSEVVAVKPRNKEQINRHSAVSRTSVFQVWEICLEKIVACQKLDNMILDHLITKLTVLAQTNV